MAKILGSLLGGGLGLGVGAAILARQECVT